MGRATSPTARCLATLRADGWTAEVVEKRLPRCFITKDLFGCIDILAVKEGEPPLGIQATSGANASHRLGKSVAVPELRTWLGAGCRFEVWSWSLRGPRGTRKTWQLRCQAVTLADLTAGPVAY